VRAEALGARQLLCNHLDFMVGEEHQQRLNKLFKGFKMMVLDKRFQIAQCLRNNGWKVTE